MSETIFNNFVAIGASNRLSLEQVELLQRAVNHAIYYSGEFTEGEVSELYGIEVSLDNIADKMKAGE